jgi:predicted Zn-dependent protease
VAIVYSIFVPGPDGLEPTSVLITARNGVIDVLADNERAAHAREEARTTSLLDETRSLRDSRRFAEALVLADEVVLLTPDSAAAYALRSTIRLALDDPNGAAEDARMALSLQPEHAEALLARAEVHRHTEDWPACIEVATTRLRDTPRDGAAWRVRAHCYLGLNKRREAAAGAREACDLGDPEGCALAKRLD